MSVARLRPDASGTGLCGLLLAGLLSAVLAGCSPLGVATTVGATAGIKASEERGFSTSVSDDAIWLDINRRLLDHDGALFEAVMLQVHEGRVLLSGEVPTQDARMEAVKIAWQPDGVNEVINELTVTTPGRNEWRDFWIAEKIDGKLLFDRKIRSINYSVEAVDGVVYLIGIAQNEDELQRVIDHCRDVAYVRRIVSYVRIKSQTANSASEG